MNTTGRALLGGAAQSAPIALPFATGPLLEKPHDPLEGLDCRELAAVYDALIGAQDALMAVHNQPRTRDSNAAEILSALHSDLSWKAQEVEHRLRAMQPADDREREERARVILHWVFQTGDHMGDVFDAAERIINRLHAERES